MTRLVAWLRLMFNVLAMVAEFESDLIRLRTKEGMRVPRRRPSAGQAAQTQPTSRRQLVSLVHSGEYRTAEVADLFGVGRSTVYRPACRASRLRHPCGTLVADQPPGQYGAIGVRMRDGGCRLMTCARARR